MLLDRLWTSLTLNLHQLSSSLAHPAQSFFGPSPASLYPNNGGKKVIDNELSKFTERLMGDFNIQGLSLAVIRPDKEVEYGAWGNATEDGDKVDPHTLYYIGSCSKAFLATSLGLLMDDYDHGSAPIALPGNLTSFNYNTKMKGLLPNDWELLDEWASEKASLIDVLSHSTGLFNHDLGYTMDDTAKDVAQRMRYLRPVFELRERYHYNNQMYITATETMWKYTSSYTEFVKKRIFAPLGMRSTFFVTSEAEDTGNFSQVWNPMGRRIPHWFPDKTTNMLAGVGGIISSVVDIAKWLRVLLDGGFDIVNNITVIPQSVVEATTTAHVISSGKASPSAPFVSLVGYGMGWARASYRGHEYVTHTGGLPGASAYLTFLPNDGIGIAILANTDNVHEAEALITFRIIEDILGLPKMDPKNQEDVPEETQKHSKPIEPSPSEEYLSAYAGTYHNPGYGSLDLCASPDESAYCRDVFKAFDAVDTAYGKQGAYHGKELLAASERIWCTHVRLVHQTGNKFDLSAPALFPHGYGKNSTAFMNYADAGDVIEAEFKVTEGVVQGFGITLDAFTADAFASVEDADKLGIMDRAFVWFDKV